MEEDIGGGGVWWGQENTKNAKLKLGGWFSGAGREYRYDSL